MPFLDDAGVQNLVSNLKILTDNTYAPYNHTHTGVAKVIVSTTQPSSPEENMIWFVEY